jgi:hypothetical protein
MRDNKWVSAARFLILFLVVAGWMGFEIFNLDTTVNALSYILGEGSQFQCLMLAAAIVAIDVGGIWRVFTPQTSGQKEPKITAVLFGVWLIVAMVNAMMTWWDIGVRMESTRVTSPASAEAILVAVPFIMAIFIFGVRVSLTYVFGSMLDNLLNGRSALRGKQETSYRPQQTQEVRRPMTDPPFTPLNGGQRLPETPSNNRSISPR